MHLIQASFLSKQWGDPHTMRYSHPGFDHTRDAVKVLEMISGQKGDGQGKDGTELAQEEDQLRVIH
jgi:hypothetical protein